MMRWPRLLAVVLAATATACIAPIRQFDLKSQTLTCEQANQYAYKTLRSMGFAITQFEPAAVRRPGTLRGSRDEHGAQSVTVYITCTGSTADIDASEDGRYLGQIEFKRAFYMGFTATASAAAVSDAAAREEALRPAALKKNQGLQVLLEPVTGLAAKLDFELDLAAAGVLPVRVIINNVTSRTYSLDPGDIVLVQKDGARVHPISVDETAQRVSDAAQSTTPESVPPSRSEVTQRLQTRLLTSRSVSANQTIKGYLYYPLAAYVKGRVTLEDQESEESEGFVVQF